MNRRNLLGSLFFGMLALCGLKRAEASPVVDSFRVQWVDPEDGKAKYTTICPTALMYGGEEYNAVRHELAINDLDYFGMPTIEGNVRINSILSFIGAYCPTDIFTAWRELSESHPEVATDAVRLSIFAWLQENVKPSQVFFYKCLYLEATHQIPPAAYDGDLSPNV